MYLDPSEDSGDITFISQCNLNEDHIDRALRNLKEIQLQNQAIKAEMEMIKDNPKAFVKDARDGMVEKINLLRDENESLRRLVEKAKAPAFTEMTKKKIVHHQNTKKDVSPFRESMKSSIRPPLSEIDSNYDKNDTRSTCLNFGPGCRSRENLQYFAESTDQESREAITMQIRLLLKRAQAFEEELLRINKREEEELKKTQKPDEKELMEITLYKKKLVKLLQKVKNREVAMSQLIKTYRTMHEQTSIRLIQATETLQALRAAKISQDVDQKYAQVLELQQRLQFINSQLQQMDESRWLQEISQELINAVRRMGIEIPKAENPRELIDELCEILIESHIVNKKDGQNKLAMLKHYHQEEKKNNSKYILGLKAKEQALGRRLIDIQMEK